MIRELRVPNIICPGCLHSVHKNKHEYLRNSEDRNPIAGTGTTTVVGCGLSSAPTGAQPRRGAAAATYAPLRTRMGVGEPREAGFTWARGFGERGPTR